MNLTRFRGNVHSINGPLNVRGSKDFSHAEGEVGRALNIEKDFRTGSYPGRNSLSQSCVQMSRSIDGNLYVRTGGCDYVDDQHTNQMSRKHR